MKRFESAYETMVINNIEYTVEKYSDRKWFVKDVKSGCCVGAPFTTKRAAINFMKRLRNSTYERINGRG